MKDISSLKKKLAGYSAMAGAMIAVNKTTDAQVIYHDIVPDSFITNNTAYLSYYLDMNNDGITDFWLTSQYSTGYGGYVDFFANNGNSFVAIDSYGYNYMAALNSCQLIATSVPGGIYNYYWRSGHYDLMNGWNDLFSPWGVNPIQGYCIDKYAGVILHLNDGNHYGWLRMTHAPNSDTLFIQDYAYEAIPDSAITTPCATQVKYVAATNLFSAFIDLHQLILHFHQSPLPSRMTLLNDLGEKLTEQSISQTEMVMDVSHFAAGIYFVEISNGDQRQVKKVVIE